MTITVQPVNERFVAEVADIDLREPLAADQIRRIGEAFEHYAVLVFPDQHLDDDQHIAFAKQFGPLDELIAHATQPQFVYSHRWRPHDLVVWDNRCTMHRGTEYDDLRWPRGLVRLSVSDEVNSCELEGLSLPPEAVISAD